MVAGVWGNWSRICSQEVQTDECWCSASSLFIQSGSPARRTELSTPEWVFLPQTFLERPLWTHPEVCFNSKPIQVDKEEPPFHTYLQTWIILITESSMLCWPWSASLAVCSPLLNCFIFVGELMDSKFLLLSVSDVSSSGTCSGPLANGSRAG